MTRAALTRATHLALLALWSPLMAPRSVCAQSLLAARLAARFLRVPLWVAVPRLASLAWPGLSRCRLLLVLRPLRVDLAALLLWLLLALVLLLVAPLA